MRPLALALAAVFAFAIEGCGHSTRIDAVAFELAWPHGATTNQTDVDVPAGSEVVSVVLGRVSLTRDEWRCLDSQTAALYRVRGTRVTVAVNDYAVDRCAALPDLGVRLVGGYAANGGYVGQWTPGAVLFRR